MLQDEIVYDGQVTRSAGMTALAVVSADDLAAWSRVEAAIQAEAARRALVLAELHALAVSSC